MDKMGSSDKTGNKGVPATPRDGAPIELTAMLFSVLRFMEDLSEAGVISTHGVEIKAEGHRKLTYKEWADRIQENFEKCYWVPQHENEDREYVIEKKLVNRRGIYKDVFKPSQAYTEYQLRPNLCIAMAYAPELFQPDHARLCLKNVENILMEPGSMGIKTLDPSDKNYRGDYIMIRMAGIIIRVQSGYGQ
jgi:glycogen debranching enzyme